MTSIDPRNIVDLHSALLQDLRSSGSIDFAPGSVTPILRHDFKMKVPDDPSKTVVTNDSGSRMGVLICSHTANPGLIARSVERAIQSKQKLGDQLGSVILDPIVHGHFQGLSYVIWPPHRTLSSSRTLKYIQKQWLISRVLSWLRDVTEATKTVDVNDGLQSCYLLSLKQITRDAQLPDHFAVIAATGIERLESQTWRPATTLEHGDFWVENLLLPQAVRNDYGFLVIDWAGAKLEGHPFFDLLRVSMSSGLNLRRLRDEIVAHCSILQCETADVPLYILAALGSIALNPEHLPRPRYLSMAQRLLFTLSSALQQ